MKREISHYIPFMAGFAGIGAVCAMLIGLTKFLGCGEMTMFNSYTKNTLVFYPEKCIGCEGVLVCPHSVFSVRRREGISQ